MRSEILKVGSKNIAGSINTAGRINISVFWNVTRFILVNKYKPSGEASTETPLLRSKTATWQDSDVKWRKKVKAKGARLITSEPWCALKWK
jgi:hypothetical protein